jgi:uncharacterized protein DUF5667
VPPVIGSVSANRRAHAFAQVLDASRLEEPRPGDEGAADCAVAGVVDAPTLSALAVVHRLTALPRPALSVETKSVQRAQLIAALESAQGAAAEQLPGQRHRRPVRAARGAQGAHRAAPVSALARLRPRSRLSKGLAASGLTMGVAVGALGGVAVASTNALPGDTLYGLKRGMEDLRLDFAGSDEDRGQVYLDHAATRLNEAGRLMERARSGDLDEGQLDDVSRALASMRDDASEGHRLLSAAYESEGSIGPIQSLSSFSDNHRGTWTRLRERLPGALRDISTEVSGVFDAIDEEIAPLQPLLPREPESGTATAGGQEAPPARQPASPRPTSSSATTTTAGTAAPAPDGSAQATSPDPSRQHEGLLDGTGLFDPPPAKGGTPSEGLNPLQPGRLPESEVTIPPLVEELLPTSLDLDMPEAEGASESESEDKNEPDT